MSDDIWTQFISHSIVYRRVEERKHTREIASIFWEYMEDMYCILSSIYKNKTLWFWQILSSDAVDTDELLPRRAAATTAAVIFFSNQIVMFDYTIEIVWKTIWQIFQFN